jgi:hypothetical protein
VSLYETVTDRKDIGETLRAQYGYGGIEEKLQLFGIVTGLVGLNLEDKKEFTAETEREGLRKTVTLNGYREGMSVEEQLQMGILLSHEAYRDGIETEDNYIETRGAVLGHTEMEVRMRDAGYDFSGNAVIAADLAAYDYAQSVGDMSLMDLYADTFYRSDGDHFGPVLGGALLGLVSSATVEFGSRVLSGQGLTEAVNDILHDPVSLENILVSTVMGGLTGGVSSALTKNMGRIGQQALANLIVNIAGGGVDAAIKTGLGNVITGEEKSVAREALKGAGSALVLSGATQVLKVSGSTNTGYADNIRPVPVRIIEPASNSAIGIAGENALPTLLDLISATFERIKDHK